MRLIDADALERIVLNTEKKIRSKNISDILLAVADLVKGSQTVNLTKESKWLQYCHRDSVRFCKNCGFGYDTHEIYFYELNHENEERHFCSYDIPFAYCPNCGAKMEV